MFDIRESDWFPLNFNYYDLVENYSKYCNSCIVIVSYLLEAAAVFALAAAFSSATVFALAAVFSSAPTFAAAVSCACPLMDGISTKLTFLPASEWEFGGRNIPLIA